MEIMNLVVTGTVGAGKTTFIRSVSEIEVVDTDRRATDEVADMKQNTTVAMDFGTLQFGDEMALHIYGTPGQIRFDFMWEILIERAHAYILLIAAHRPSEFHHARRIMNFMNRKAQIPMIIGITHSDCEGAWTQDDIALALGYQDSTQQPPIVLVAANDGESVAISLIALVEHYMQMTAAAAVAVES
ncbi:ATP/GTP-binding protein [Chamaesiphon sp. GL140_3_metabinner_50]|uniref:GTP-binding protein n=1 Tax=Chamaesiphon sp. GL140_3_metabinner_50 TaxID=2970812 RepID=UPI003457D16F